ncbi:MAG: ribonuclease III [Clostridiales bacterium]|nr:ribonuclease III [Clostridiales bacterium]
MNSSDINSIQARINYKFENTKLLVAALTHSSYVNEHEAIGNERIEFLGDCVLNFLVGEKLFSQDPTASEGKLSARRAAIVSRAPLARIVDLLGLVEFLQVGAGVDKNNFSDKARSDVFEAVVGAVYMDGGLEAARRLLEDIFYCNVTPEHDYKSELQELSSAQGLKIEYSPAQEVGGKFKVHVCVGDSTFTGEAKSKHAAEVDAAKKAVKALCRE